MQEHGAHRKTAIVASFGLVGCYSTSLPSYPDTGSESDTSAGPTATMTSGPSSSSSGESTETGIDTSTTTVPDSADGSSSTTEAMICGDGEVGDGEVCDDGVNDGSYGGCMADCAARGPHCGDGESNGGELCDDGNDVNGDGCNLDCVISGTVLWTRTFAGDSGARDAILSVAVGPDDGIALAGVSVVPDSPSEGLLLYYDADGSLTWSDTHQFGSNSTVVGVAVDSEGNVGIAGTANGRSMLTALYSSEGELQWDVSTPDVGGADLAAYGAAFDDAGNLYAAGDLYLGSWDIAVRKLSSVGGLVWEETYDGGQRDVGYGIAVRGDVAVVVGLTDVTETDTNGWIRRYGLDGSTAWTREFAGVDEAYDETWGVAVDPAGFVVVSGLTSDGHPTEGQAWLRKYDLDGTEEWTLLLEAGCAFGVAIDEASQISVVGALDMDTNEWFVARYLADGTELWVDYPNAGAAEPEGGIIRGVAVDSHANVVVAASQNEDVWVQKYAP